MGDIQRKSGEESRIDGKEALLQWGVMVAECTICLSTLRCRGVDVDGLVGSTNDQAHERRLLYSFHDTPVLIHPHLCVIENRSYYEVIIFSRYYAWWCTDTILQSTSLSTSVEICRNSQVLLIMCHWKQPNN
jgi:hypothetical protein